MIKEGLYPCMNFEFVDKFVNKPPYINIAYLDFCLIFKRKALWVRQYLLKD